AGHRRTETAALPPAPRRRPDHPQRQPHPAADRPPLALARRAGGRVRPPSQPTPTGNLTQGPLCLISSVTDPRPAPARQTPPPTLDRSRDTACCGRSDNDAHRSQITTFIKQPVQTPMITALVKDRG